MLSRTNLAIASLASGEASRFTLNGILVTPTETVVTNGHTMTICPTPDVDVDSYPELHNFKATKEFTPFIMPQKVALDLLKQIPKNSTHPVLMNVAIGTGATTDHVQVATTDLQTQNVQQISPLTGNYPDYKRVIPKDEDLQFSITLSGEYIRDIVNIHIKHQDVKRGSTPVVLKFRDSQHAMVIESRGDTPLKSVIMPHRQEGNGDKASVPPIDRRGDHSNTRTNLIEGEAAPASSQTIQVAPTHSMAIVTELAVRTMKAIFTSGASWEAFLGNEDMQAKVISAIASTLEGAR